MEIALIAIIIIDIALTFGFLISKIRKPDATLEHKVNFDSEKGTYKDTWEFIMHKPTDIWQKKKYIIVKIKNDSF